MATIRTAIQLYDGFSNPLRSVTNALNIAINSFETMQKVSSKAIDVSSIQAARAELNRAEIVMNEYEETIRKADQAQQKLNNDMNSTHNSAGALMGKLKGIVASLAAGFGLQQLVQLSDNMTNAKARIDLINDGLQTTAELQKKIMQSANDSRTSYLDTANVVGKLGILAGGSFKNNQEMVFFAEQMNKQFKIGGSSLQESTSAMYQLTQAMAAGKLQGDEFRSIMENAPLLAQAIAKYTGKSMGELKKMSAEGTITAEVIKNAMFMSAEETNKKFAEMPMTFAQVGTVIGNTMLQAFEPAIQGFGRLAQTIYDNWSTLEPIFWGLVTALGAYAVITWIANAAAKAFFITLLTNPITWIALAIGVLISMIYKWVQSVGGMKVAWMIAMNVIQTAWENIQMAFVYGSAVVKDAVGNMSVGVLSRLQNMVNGAIDLINGFIKIVNKIPGVGIDVISHVTFATEAAVQNNANHKARVNAVNDMASTIMVNRSQREMNIRNAQSAAYAAQNQNDYSPQINQIAANTGSMKDKMDASEEDLKYLRDLAEQEVVNRFTTAEVKVEMTNHNNISSDMDLDGVISHFGSALEETLASVAEGV